MFRFSMQTLAYFLACVFNENLISEVCMVCLLPSGSHWTFWCWLKERKLFSQIGPTGRESYSMVCRLNSTDHACHWLGRNAPLQCPLATIFFSMEERSLRSVGTKRFHRLDICYSVIFLACAPKLVCVFWLNRVVSDLAKRQALQLATYC